LKQIVFITPEDAQFGFALTGLNQIVTDPGGVAAAISDATRDERGGVIFVDERLHQHLDEEWLNALEKQWPGLIVVLPAPEGAEQIFENYAMQLIVKAIGYQVRLQL